MRAWIAGLMLLAGCGGDDGPGASGVDPTRPVMALTAAELETLCTWSVDEQGGAGHVSSCGDFDSTTLTVSECVAAFTGATCDAVVADIEACLAAIEGDSCRLLTEPACEVMFTCAPD